MDDSLVPSDTPVEEEANGNIKSENFTTGVAKEHPGPSSGESVLTAPHPASSDHPQFPSPPCPPPLSQKEPSIIIRMTHKQDLHDPNMTVGALLKRHYAHNPKATVGTTASCTSSGSSDSFSLITPAKKKRSSVEMSMLSDEYKAAIDPANEVKVDEVHPSSSVKVEEEDSEEDDEDGDHPRRGDGSNTHCADCNRKYDPDCTFDTFWIACHACGSWYHGRCVDVDEIEGLIIEKYICLKCQVEHGKTVYKPMVAPHRFRYELVEEIDKLPQVGSKQWIEDFVGRESDIPAPAYGVSIMEDGIEFEETFDTKKEWTDVYLVKGKKGLQLNMPHEDFSIQDCIGWLGGDLPVDTIDVYRQTTKSMQLQHFKERWDNPDRSLLYNILSLEFSRTEMARVVWPPKIVRDLSWVHALWPRSQQAPPSRAAPPPALIQKRESEENGEGAVKKEEGEEAESVNGGEGAEKKTPVEEKLPPLEIKGAIGLPPPSSGELSPVVNDEDIMMKPEVSMFCLLGMKGSYTDFHIDFGGSSVWYHVFRGKKIFYIAAPTKRNIELYRHHQNINLETREKWLGDQLRAEKELGRVELNAGQTLLIPAGWIHAVLTPEDSMVFGGNFLHTLNITTQLKVYDIEVESRIDAKFLFPNFELTNWYAAKAVAAELRDYNDDAVVCEDYLFSGAKRMLEYLQRWTVRDQLKPHNVLRKFGPPIVKMLNKELTRQVKIRQKRSKRGSNSPEYRQWKPKAKVVKKTNGTGEGIKMTIRRQSSRSSPLGDSPPSTVVDPISVPVMTSSPSEVPSSDVAPSVDGLIEPIDPATSFLVRVSAQSPTTSNGDGDVPSTNATATCATATADGLRVTLKFPAGNLPAQQKLPRPLPASDQEKYASVSAVRIKEKRGEEDCVGHMFAQRSSSGRERKPTNLIREMAGDQIDRQRQRVIESGEEVPERVPVDYTAEMDRAAAREEREMEEEERRKKGGAKKKTGKAIGRAISETVSSKPASKKAPQSAKARLAKKMGLR